MAIRRGIAGRLNTSFEVMPCSAPGMSGTIGVAPVAMRMVAAVTFVPSASAIWFGPVSVAR